MSKSSWPMSEQLNQVQTRPLNCRFVSSMITCFLNHCFWDSLLYNIGALKKLTYRGYKRVIVKERKGSWEEDLFEENYAMWANAFCSKWR